MVRPWYSHAPPCSWDDVTVSERPISLRELLRAHEDGSLVEAFGCGTACVVQPVGGLVRTNGERLAIGDGGGEGSSLSSRLFKALLDIQYARVNHEWSVPFE